MKQAEFRRYDRLYGDAEVAIPAVVGETVRLPPLPVQVEEGLSGDEAAVGGVLKGAVGPDRRTHHLHPPFRVEDAVALVEEAFEEVAILGSHGDLRIARVVAHGDVLDEVGAVDFRDLIVLPGPGELEEVEPDFGVRVEHVHSDEAVFRLRTAPKVQLDPIIRHASNLPISVSR